MSYVNLRRQDLRSQELHEVKLVGADLSGCNLEKADLSGADLSQASLERARLRGLICGEPSLPGELRQLDITDVRVDITFAAAFVRAHGANLHEG